MDDGQAMTVGQLIDALTAFGHDAKVVLDGCDCYGDLKAVMEQEDGVYLLRFVPS
jgi:hypothetical protein